MTLVAARPGPGPARPYQFPAVRRSESSAHAVVAADLPGRGLGAVSLLLPGGITGEPIAFAGASQLTARMLTEGTRNRTAEEFALAVEALGVNVGASASWGFVELSVRGPVGRLADGVDLLVEAFGDTRLDVDDFQRLRDEQVESLRMAWSQPGTRAGSAFRRAVHDVDTRFGFPESGDEMTVAGLTLEDIAAIRTRWLTARGTVVAAADLAVLDLDRIAAAFPAGAGEAPATGSAFTTTEHPTRVLLIDRPGAVQSSVVLGHRGPSRGTADFASLTTMASVLGGMFNSRLNHRLREVKGYCYGIGAGFDMGRVRGVFRSSTEVRTDVTVPAVTDAVAEIVRMQHEGVTDQEAGDALAFQAGSFPIQLETPGAVANALTTIVKHDLPDDYFTRLRAELRSLGRADLDRAARTYLQPDLLQIVIEGDMTAFGAELEGSDLPPAVRLNDADLRIVGGAA